MEFCRFLTRPKGGKTIKSARHNTPENYINSTYVHFDCVAVKLLQDVNLNFECSTSWQNETKECTSRMNKRTLSAEKTRGGTVKGRRFGPPVIICFLTVHII